MNFIENQSPEKLRGGYYTPVPIASFLARWVAGSRPRSILEPACGEGAFFEAIARDRPPSLRCLTGFEVDGEAAAKARGRAERLRGVATEIHRRDFLAWAVRHLGDDPGFDGVLGNPPFIRYQYLPEALQNVSEKLFARLGMAYTRHTNAWVPFVLASVCHLRDGGRLGMVVPAELLHVLHAQSLRTFLLDRCARIVVIDPKELWFADALQGVVLLLVEKRGGGRVPREGLAIVSDVDARILDVDPERVARRAERVDRGLVEQKWMPALIAPDARSLWARLSQHEHVRRFREVADVDVGIVTGANGFFLVDDATVERYRLRRWARPMYGRSEHVRGVIYDREAHRSNAEHGLPASFLEFGDAAWASLPADVRRYIRLGERQSLPTRYKCRIRKPWYRVPSVWPSPVGMLKRSHHYPRLILNKLAALTTDTAYRIRPRGIAAERLTRIFINSVTMLSAEVEGRHYGGGVLELVPSEIERLLLPVTAKRDRAVLADLHRWFLAGMPADEVLGRQDARVLPLLGLGAEEQQLLFRAWQKLRDRRQRSATSSTSTPGRISPGRAVRTAKP
jgi:adenine-specific DNA-methyltransferase